MKNKRKMFPYNLTKYDILGSFLKNGFVDYANCNHLKIQLTYIN